MTTAHDIVIAYWAAAEARGKEAYLRFNAEGFPTDWHVAVKRIAGEGRNAASWVELADAAGPMTGVCFFDLTAEGKIQAITDFWPAEAKLPPSRAHLVERY